MIAPKDNRSEIPAVVTETSARRTLFARPQFGIAARLLASVLLFSSLVTLVLTALQLYLDYRRDVDVIGNRLSQIGESSLGSFGESLWNLDERQIALQLDGIVSLPGIRFAEIRETAGNREPLVVSAGQPDATAAIVREFPIVYAFGSTGRSIGTLRVEATLTDIYRELISRGLVILASQGAKTFLVSLFIIYIVHRIITRHLGSIASFVAGVDPRRQLPRFGLLRHPPRKRDELDQVVQALNEMSSGVRQIYGELQESEQRFHDFAEVASDWFWETGPDHRLTYISERVARLGFDPAMRLNHTRWDLAADREEEPEKWRQHFAALERHEPFRDFVFRANSEAGMAKFLSVGGKPIFDPSGRFAGYRGVGSDITAAVVAERALREAKEQEISHQAQKMKSEAERLELLHRLINMQENERLRIARELHDQTGQDLTGLSLGLKSLEAAIDDERAHATLRWLRKLTTQIGSNLHRAAGELRPTSLDDIGLLRALETHLADWSERFGIAADLHARGVETNRFLPEVETTIYRVVQEALTNVLKHASATTVSLVLECHDGSLQVIIEDNGSGFDPEASAARGRFGLAGMRERLALVNGTLSIDSTPGVGTTLYVRVPIGRVGRTAQDVA